MAKTNTVLIKLVSSADTGFFYVTKKNPRTKTNKLELKKFDPVARKHVIFKEAKIKEGCPRYPGRRLRPPAIPCPAPRRAFAFRLHQALASFDTRRGCATARLRMRVFGSAHRRESLILSATPDVIRGSSRRTHAADPAKI